MPVLKVLHNGEWVHVSGGSGSTDLDSVRYSTQDLTEDQKAQARANIGVGETIVDTLATLDLISTITDDSGSLAEADGTILVTRNDDIFLPEVTSENDGNVLKVVDGEWTVGALEIPEVNYPVTSVNGQTGDVTIDIPKQTEITVNGVVADENGNIQIEVGSEQVQADLSQNDSTQPDYVKNRTHWEENNQTVIEWDGSTEGLENFNIFGGSTDTFYKVSDLTPNYADFIGAELIVEGETQVITEEDMVEMSQQDTNLLLIGEGLAVFYNTTFEFQGESFTAPSTGLFVSPNSFAPFTLTYGSTTIHTLDEKFIPESIARKSDIPEVNYPVTSVNGMTGDVVIEGGSGGGVSSWNDLTDKPFYEEDVTTVVVENITVSLGTGPAGMMFTSLPASDLPVSFTVGSTYTIVINGVEYTCTASEWVADDETPFVYVGDSSIYAELNTSGDPPFFLGYIPEEGIVMFIVVTTASSVILSVYEGSKVIHKLDRKYLPEGIGYEEDIPDTEILPLYETDGYYSTMDIPTVELEEDLEYIVTFNGVEYKCVTQVVYAEDNNGNILPCGWLLGNGTIGPEGKYGVIGNDEPFYIMSYLYDGNMVSEIYVDGTDASAHPTVSVTRLAHTAVRKIADEYLPDVNMTDRHIIEWDGTTDARHYETQTVEGVESRYYLVSTENLPRAVDLIGGVITVYRSTTGETVSVTVTADALSGYTDSYDISKSIYVIQEDNTTLNDISFTYAGVYFAMETSISAYIKSLEYYSESTYQLSDAINRMTSDIGVLSDLKTTDKSDIVKAINEVHTKTPVWNDLVDTPFIKEGSTGTYEWDGTYSADTDVYFTIGNYVWVRVSNIVPTNFKINSVLYKYKTSSSVTISTRTVAESKIVRGNGATQYDSYVLTVNNEEFTLNGKAYTAPSKGVYMSIFKYGNITTGPLAVNYSYTITSLKDRTHWTEPTWVPLLEETTLTFGDYDSTSTNISPRIANITNSTRGINFVWNTPYKVIWNGTEYEVTFTYNESTTAIDRYAGNSSLASDPTAEGLPFYIGRTTTSSLDALVIYAQGSTAEAVTLEIYEKGLDYVPLDERYIPESVARTSDIPVMAAIPDVTAAPTMEEFNALLAALRSAGLMATE